MNQNSDPAKVKVALAHPSDYTPVVGDEITPAGRPPVRVTMLSRSHAVVVRAGLEYTFPRAEFVQSAITGLAKGATLERPHYFSLLKSGDRAAALEMLKSPACDIAAKDAQGRDIIEAVEFDPRPFKTALTERIHADMGNPVEAEKAVALMRHAYPNRKCAESVLRNPTIGSKAVALDLPVILEAWLKAGGDANAKEASGISLIGAAICADKRLCALKLITAGADLLRLDELGCSAANYAKMKSPEMKNLIATALIKQGLLNSNNENTKGI